MGSFRNIYTDHELESLREENEALREEVERLTQLADQYLMALCVRVLEEPLSDHGCMGTA